MGCPSLQSAQLCVHCLPEAPVALWPCPGTLAPWEAKPGITNTHHMGFAAAERDGGAVHGPYGFDLGHVTSNNLRGKKKNVKERLAKLAVHVNRW